MEINKPNFTQKNQNNSAKKSYNGITNVLNALTSNLGDPVAQGNANTLMNIAKMFL